MDAINLDIVDYILNNRGKTIAIEADTGEGKTSLLTYIFAEIYNRTHIEEEYRLKQNADVLRNMGYTNVNAGNHCIYTNFKNKLFIPTKWLNFRHLVKYRLKDMWNYAKWQFKALKCHYKAKTKQIKQSNLNNEDKALLLEDYKYKHLEFEPLKVIKPYSCELKDLRVPNDKTPYKHFEYGSFIGISEAVSEDYNNLEGQYDIPMHKFLKRKRHNLITILLETQKFGRSAKWFRENINVLFFIKKRYNYANGVNDYYCYLYEGSEFIENYGYKHVSPLSNSQLESLKQKGKSVETLEQIKYVKITAKLPISIYDYYDQQEHQFEFVEGLENYQHATWADDDVANNKEEIEKQAQKRRERERAEELVELKQKILDEQYTRKAKLEIEKQLNQHKK